MKTRHLSFLSSLLLLGSIALSAQSREYKVYQFPADQLPVIDGKGDDWERVPESYVITLHDMREDEGKHACADSATLAIRVKVGWSKADNRLWFLYEATDDYWRFGTDDLRTDMFEVVVDADRSGAPFIDRFHPDAKADVWQKWFNFHGRHAQNYHIFTPPHATDWCMLWGPQVWLKQAPYAGYAYDYDFSEGEGGKLTLEFFITPYDDALANGPEQSVPSVLTENERIGLCWAVIDYDADATDKDGFWNLSSEHTMYGNADFLLPFRLMPFEK